MVYIDLFQSSEGIKLDIAKFLGFISFTGTVDLQKSGEIYWGGGGGVPVRGGRVPLL